MVGDGAHFRPLYRPELLTCVTFRARFAAVPVQGGADGGFLGAADGATTSCKGTTGGISAAVGTEPKEGGSVDVAMKGGGAPLLCPTACGGLRRATEEMSEVPAGNRQQATAIAIHRAFRDFNSPRSARATAAIRAFWSSVPSR